MLVLIKSLIFYIPVEAIDLVVMESVSSLSSFCFDKFTSSLAGTFLYYYLSLSSILCVCVCACVG